MKKFIPITLVIALAFTLAACGGSDTPSSKPEQTRPSDTPTTTPEPTPEPTPAPTPEPLPAPELPLGSIIKFGDYYWQVLDNADGRALLFSADAVRSMSHLASSWEQSDIRTWLNDSFYNTFNAEDRARIALTDVINEATNPLQPGEMLYGSGTQDYIFLLNIDEAAQYFGGQTAWLGSYARFANKPEWEVYEGADRSWLRTVFTDYEGMPCSYYLDDNGNFDGNNIARPYENLKLHPALWVEIDDEIMSQPVLPAVFEPPAQVGSTIQFGGYDCRVLEVWGDRAFVVTEDTLESRAYHSVSGAVTWEQCDLRAYLNGGFLENLSTDDRARVVQTAVVTDDIVTDDYIFILSYDEVQRYFPEWGTAAARNASSSGAMGYWTRVNTDNGEVRVIMYDGGTWGSPANDTSGGDIVRPAMWIRLG